MKTRVIVANNARARIFASNDVMKHLAEQEDFIHEEAHLSNQELVSDAPGKTRDNHGVFDPETSPKKHEAQTFAHLLARRLKELHNEEHFDQLILIATPTFLGLLRKALPDPLEQLLEKTIDKDLTTATTEEIIEDNTSRWSGNHLMSPDVVPGVLLTNRKLSSSGHDLTDVTATVLSHYGIKPLAGMTGESIF